MIEDKDKTLNDGSEDPYESILDKEEDVDPFDSVLKKQPVLDEKPVKIKVKEEEKDDFFNPISTKKKDRVRGDGSVLSTFVALGTISVVFLILLYILVSFLDAIFKVG